MEPYGTKVPDGTQPRSGLRCWAQNVHCWQETSLSLGFGFSRRRPAPIRLECRPLRPRRPPGPPSTPKTEGSRCGGTGLLRTAENARQLAKCIGHVAVEPAAAAGGRLCLQLRLAATWEEACVDEWAHPRAGGVASPL